MSVYEVMDVMVWAVWHLPRKNAVSEKVTHLTAETLTVPVYYAEAEIRGRGKIEEYAV